jgi:hypothetical protein
VSSLGARCYITDYPATTSIAGGSTPLTITAAYVAVRGSNTAPGLPLYPYPYAALGYCSMYESGWMGGAHYFWEWEQNNTGIDSGPISLGTPPGNPPGSDVSNSEKYGILKSSGNLNLYINGTIRATLSGLTWTPAQCIWGEAQSDTSDFVIGGTNHHTKFTTVQYCNSKGTWTSETSATHVNNNSYAGTSYGTDSFQVWDTRTQ